MMGRSENKQIPRIDNGDQSSRYKYAPKVTIEFHIEFDEGSGGELAIPITIDNTRRITGNPIVASLDLDGWDRSFKVSYPIEATHASIRIVRTK